MSEHISLKPDQRVINFVTPDNLNHYGIYKSKNTTIAQLINTSNKYAVDSKGENDKFEFYSNELERKLEGTEIIKSIFGLKLEKISKITIKSKQPKCTINLQPIIGKNDDLKKWKGQIFIKFQRQIGPPIINTLDVDSTMTVEQVKILLQNKCGLPADQQKLIYTNKQLEDNRTLQDYKIQDCSTLYLLLLSSGGMYHVTSGNEGNYNKLGQNIFDCN